MNEKHVMVLRHVPKKKFFIISAKLTEQVGVLADLSKLLAVRGMTILEGHIHVPNPSYGYVTLLAEATDPATDADLLRQVLKGSIFLQSLTVIESKGGMIIDSVNFPLVGAMDRRAVLMSAESMRDLFDLVAAKWGKEAEDLIYGLGVGYGNGFWAELSGALGKDKDSMQEYLEFFSAIGMARATVERFKSNVPSLEVSVERLFECEGVTSKAPKSVFFRGVLAGSSSSLFGREMTARETDCIATGDKKCKFDVIPMQQQ